MPKLNVYSRDNTYNTLGFLDLHLTWLDQSVTTTSNPTFNNIISTGDVVIAGDLTVNGSSTIISTNIVEIEDNVILINSTESGSGVTLNLAGIEIERGSLANFQTVFEETTDIYKIGEVGSLQAVATREDSPLDKGVMVYNDTLNRLDSVTNIELPITFSAGVNSNSSSTGTILINNNGGLGVTGNISVDNYIYFKGSVYSSHIHASTSNELIVTSGSNFVFSQLASSQIKIPTNVYLTFSSASKYIYSDSSVLYMVNTTGNISLNTQTSGSVLLPNNSYIEWTPSNRLRYNGSNITLDSTGNFIISCPVLINNTTNSTNSSNGGAFTSLGGGAIAKDLYIGQNLDVNGLTTLDQTSINTDDGVFSVSGNNNVDIQSTLGSISLNSLANLVNITGNSGVNIDSSAEIAINSTDTVNGISIGTQVSSIPVYIGNNTSETYINDNLTVSGNLTILGTSTFIDTDTTLISDNSIIVNSLPTGISDGGYLVKRYQLPNDTNSGRVITDNPVEISTFQSGSSTPGTLILNTTASAIDDYYVGWWIQITSGLGINQVRRIKTYSGSTKTATIYITSDNTTNFQDGLDLSTAPSNGDSYSLYDCTYSSIIYSELNNEFRFICLANDITSGTFTNPNEYINIHVNKLTTENTITSNNDIIIDHTSTEAFLVRKDGDTGDVFTVDSTNGNIYIANPINTVSSDTTLLFQQLDNLNNVSTYSQINSVISDNTSGSLVSNLIFSIQKSNLVPFITLDGNGFVDFSTDIDSIRVFNTTPSTSSTTGSVLFSGSLGISNTTDAISSTNGGTITTAGGAAIAKKLYVGTDLSVSGTATITSLTAPHGGLTGLLNDDHTQYALLAGRSGGQILTGGTTASNNLTLRSTTDTTKGSIIIDETTSSTSSSTGALVLSGGLGINNSTNATSTTNGGALTIAGGTAIALDLYVGGSLNAGISSPSTTISNEVNITGTVNTHNLQLISNGNERIFSMTFRFSPTSSFISTNFEFTIPDISSFINIYDIIITSNGYYNDVDPINLENLIGFAIVSTNRAKIKCTSANTSVHTIQIICRYSV